MALCEDFNIVTTPHRRSSSLREPVPDQSLIHGPAKKKIAKFF
jgi:hypothetical protein